MLIQIFKVQRFDRYITRYLNELVKKSNEINNYKDHYKKIEQIVEII